jgi:hypothetical protein
VNDLDEIFVNIKDFSDYEISNLGRIKSKKGNKQIIMSTSISNAGYKTVKMRKDGKYYTKTVHKLVALHFLSKETENLIVNHKDGDKTNNFVDNLEWITNSENIKHAYESGLRTVTQKMKDTVTKRNIEGRKAVVKIDPNTDEIIKEYPSVNIAAESEQVSAGDISKCCKGYRIKTLKGFKYRYKGQENLEYMGRYKNN